MLMDRYQKAVDELFAKVRATQTENIIKAGNMIAECVSKGGGVFLAGICHSIEADLLYRGGGPIFYKKFDYKPTLPVQGRKRDRSALGYERQTVGDARYALQYSNIQPGDILVVSSVSGRTQAVVDLAWEAIQMGIQVIAFSIAAPTAVDVGPTFSGTPLISSEPSPGQPQLSSVRSDTSYRRFPDG